MDRQSKWYSVDAPICKNMEQCMRVMRSVEGVDTRVCLFQLEIVSM